MTGIVNGLKFVGECWDCSEQGDGEGRLHRRQKIKTKDGGVGEERSVGSRRARATTGIACGGCNVERRGMSKPTNRRRDQPPSKRPARTCPDCQAFFPRRHREREPGAAFHTTIQGRSTTANEAWRTWLVGADPLLPPPPSTGRSLLARGRDFCLPLRRHHGRICLLVLIRTCSCVDPPLVVEASANFPPGCFPSLMYSGFGAERSSFW